jgi:hypothetical protein
MAPVGFSKVTRSFETSASKRARQRSGPVDGRCLAALPEAGLSRRALDAGNHTPPMPRPLASCAPTSSGLGCGTISNNLVGRDERSWASQRKSASVSWTPRDNRMRPSDLCCSASWRRLKRPLLPGMAMAMERNSPRTCCHFLTEIRCWVGGIA